MYRDADGVTRDGAEAASLYERACELGVLWGCAFLGDLQRRGTGVPRDVEAACDAYKRACDNGLDQVCRTQERYCR